MPFTEEQKILILELAQQGLAVGKIRQAVDIDINSFYACLREDLNFADIYSRARQDGLEELADQLVDIPDEYGDPVRGRLKSDNIKFLLSKRKPHVYGDRLDLNVTNNVDIRGALEEARQRALPIRDLKALQLPQVLDKIQQIASSSTGSEPVDADEDAEAGTYLNGTVNILD